MKRASRWIHYIDILQYTVSKTLKLRRFRKIAKRDYYIRHIWPPVWMEQLESHGTDFHEVRRRAVSALKIKIPSKICVKDQQMQQLFIQFITYVWYLLHVLVFYCHLQGAFLVPSERCSIKEHGVSSGVVRMRTTPLDTTRPSTIFYRLLLN
jgi:hypothetical protein